jgi:uncharacterized protein YsxB (DUF464 family)
MTNITIEKADGIFTLESVGHCEHDICVAISALVNSIVQYGKNYEQKNLCFFFDTYKYGCVKIRASFRNDKVYKRFLRGIDGLLVGLELYENNYPNDVKINKIG